MNNTQLTQEGLIGLESPQWMEAVECMSDMDMDKSIPNPKILLVDDDPVFCKALSQTAKKMGLEIKTCDTMERVADLPKKLPFDLIIVDYFFGEVPGTQLSYLFGQVPVLLISGTERSKLSSHYWPQSVKQFVHKGVGIEGILRSALGLFLLEEISPRLKDWQTPTEKRSTQPLWLTLLLILTCLIALWKWSAQDTSPKNPFLWDEAPQSKISDWG